MLFYFYRRRTSLIILLLVSLLSKSSPTTAFLFPPGSNTGVIGIRRSSQTEGIETTRFKLPISGLTFSTTSSTIKSKTCLSAATSLWDRLGLEEDEEPMWYILNCVAGNELALLQQCRMACADLVIKDNNNPASSEEEDAVAVAVADSDESQVEEHDKDTDQKVVVKFVVPTVSSIRSHGANRMVNDVKVKYPGYVFAKVRLSRVVYERIQDLDLCRSWMGTVNHKGYKKLPPSPLALNEDEIEKFGLEEVSSSSNDSNDIAFDISATKGDEDADGVIVDLEDDEDEQDNRNKKEIDPVLLKVYQGLKVDDMVKVTATNSKFYNEDGVVRRLKGGKILLRFYTYGTMYEEWIEPSHVRKLSSMEILRGLSGPAQPITQRDFDTASGPGPGRGRGFDNDGNSYRRGGSSSNDNYNSNNNNDNMFRQAFGGGGAGAGGWDQRNRRQDRVANSFRSNNRDNYGMNGDEQQRRDERNNWNWYKDQQQQQRQSPAGRDGGGSNRFGGTGYSRRDGASALSDVDSQWGRNSNRKFEQRPQRPQRQQQQQRREYSPSSFENRRSQAAIDGQGDWSAFVSSTASVDGTSRKGMAGSSNDKGSSSDDFFDNLMDDLSRESDGFDDSTSFASSSSSSRDNQQQTSSARRRSNNNFSTKDDDDFFASLMSELKTATTTTTTPAAKTPSTNSNKDNVDDGLFASLLSTVSDDDAKSSKSKRKTSPQRSNVNLDDDDNSYNGGDDDFFASLEAQLGNAFENDPEGSTTATTTTSDGGNNDSVFGDKARKRRDATGVTNESVEDANHQQHQEDSATSSPSTPPPPPPALSPTKSKKTQSTKVLKSSATTTSPLPSNLDKRTVPVLKELLRERGLKVTGKKSELIERLAR